MTIKHEEIKIRIRNFICNEFGLEAETGIDELSLFLNGTLDSMDLLNIVIFIEKNFDFKIPPYEVGLDSFNTIDSISQYIHSKLTS